MGCDVKLKMPFCYFSYLLNFYSMYVVHTTYILWYGLRATRKIIGKQKSLPSRFGWTYNLAGTCFQLAFPAYAKFASWL